MITYGDIKRAVLELINQSTIAGEAVPLTYNNQADYVRRIPNLINQAIMAIRTSTLPDRREAVLEKTGEEPGVLLYALPADCKSLISGGVYRMGARGPVYFHNFRLSGRTVRVPWRRPCRHGEGPPPEPPPPPPPEPPLPPEPPVYAEYVAFPVQLPPDPEDDCELTERPDVLQAAEYYAAAHLVMMEDEFAFATLKQEYETRLAAMVPPVTAETHPIRGGLDGTLSYTPY